MKDKVFDKHGNQVINTGYKKFDKATNYIGDGNVFANTQTSFYITTWNDVLRNNTEFKEGELLKADLRYFGNVKLPRAIHDIIYDKERDYPVCLYKFHNDGDILGWVLTNHCNHLLESTLMVPYHSHLQKRYDAFEEVKKYILCDGTFKIPEEILKEFKRTEKKDDFTSCIDDGEYKYVLVHHQISSGDNKREAIKYPYVKIYKSVLPSSNCGYGKLVDMVQY